MKRVALLAILISSPALSQPQSQPSPEVEALGQRLMSEIAQGVQCNTNAIALRRELDRVNAELRRLRDNYEPEPKR